MRLVSRRRVLLLNVRKYQVVRIVRKIHCIIEFEEVDKKSFVYGKNIYGFCK